MFDTGLVSMTIPMYIAETSPPALRGSLTVVNNLFITGRCKHTYASQMKLFLLVCFITRDVHTGGQMIAGIVDGAFADVDNGWRYVRLDWFSFACFVFFDLVESNLFFLQIHAWSCCSTRHCAVHWIRVSS